MGNVKSSLVLAVSASLLLCRGADAQTSILNCSDTSQPINVRCYGRLTMPNDDLYDGEWVAGKPDGEGILTSLNGAVYKGHFQSGKFHGEGSVDSNSKCNFP